MNIFINEKIKLDGSEWIPENKEELTNCVKSFLFSLEYFKYLPEATIYYSSLEMKLLLANLQSLDQMTDYSITNPLFQIKKLLSDIESIDWFQEKKQKTNYSYYFVFQGGHKTIYINGTSISEACEHIFLNSNSALLSLTSSEFNTSGEFYVLRSSITPPNGLHLIKAMNLINVHQIYQHFSQIRNQRVYNWNSKHGEYGKGVISNGKHIVSPLEGSRDEATKLLKEAIGNRKKKELYSFDKSKNKYMVYKCDSDNSKSYHSYHPINQEEVPNDVKEFINKLYEEVIIK